MGTQFMVSHHDFKSDVKNVDYGTEWNLSATKKIGAVAYTIKYAMFEGGGSWKESAPTATSPAIVSDTTKFWLQADWNF